MKSEAEIRAVIEDCRLVIKTVSRSPGSSPDDMAETAAVCMALEWVTEDQERKANVDGLVNTMRRFAAHIRTTRSAHQKANLQ